MYDLLIVDDEPIILNFLKDSVDWNKFNINEVQTACDGNDAIKKLSNFKPAVIITDLKMPIVDGIGLIKWCLSKQLNIKFVVISSYDDFYMVKEAFKLGIEEYILKCDIDDNSIGNIVLKAIKKLQQEDSENGFNENDNIAIKQQYLKNLFNSSGIKLKKPATIRFSENYIMVSCAKIKITEDFKTLWENDIQLSKYALYNIINEILGLYECGEMFFDDLNKMVLIFSGNKNIQIDEIITKINKEIYNVLNITLNIGVYKTFCNVDDISISLKKASIACNYCFFTDKNYVDYHQIPDKKTTERISNLYNKFKLYLDANDFKSIRDDNSLYPMQYYIDTFEDIYKLYGKYYILLENIAQDCSVCDFMVQYNNILECGNIKELHDYLIKTVNVIYITQQDKYDVIELAKEYIEKNYHNQINLKTASEKFNVQYSWLSKSFIRKTSMSFSSYLTEVRLVESVRLMDTTDYKLNEIATMVGYNNYEHFSREFHKKYKKWPKESI